MPSLINWKKTIPISIQRNPFFSLQNELNRAMEDFYGMLEMPRTPTAENFMDLTLSPAVDIVEDKESFKVEIEMPGLDEKDIKVFFSDGMLTVKGEKKISSKNEKKNYVSREISYGSYERRVALPSSVDVERAEATFKKGMLWVNIPKKTESVKLARELSIKNVEGK